MDFKLYLANVGDKTAAQLLATKERTIRAWRTGERQPTSAKALKIVAATNGKVTLSDIFKAA